MYFGNMTFGSGLAAAFSNTGNAYAQGVMGWIGQDTDATKQMLSVRVTSQSNGFDASGTTSQITLQVRGADTVPTASTSGVLLGSLPAFTDVNAITVKTVTLSTPSKYLYVWVVVTTEVWSAVTYVEYIYDAAVGVNFRKITANTVIKKSCDQQLPLPQGAAVMEMFTTRFEITTPTVCTLNFQANMVHRGELFSPKYLGVVGVGVSFEYRFALTASGVSTATAQRFKNACSGINIYDRNPAHYGAVTVATAELLPVGFYELIAYGSAHTDADIRDGFAGMLVEGGRGLNGLVLSLLPNAAYFEN